MTFRPPNDDNTLIPVVLFPNRGEGFGYGLTRDLALPEGYDRTMNMTVRGGRIFGPSYAPSILGRYTASYIPSEPSFLVPWEDTSGVPLMALGTGSAARVLKNGLISAETDATTATYGGAAFHDDGAGTAYLYAGTTTGSKLLNRRSQAATWAEDADVSAIYLVSAGGALWRTTSDYQISKCPAGSEPFTVGNWGAAIQVGTNEAAITNLGALGAAPIVFKEDGIYPYNEADARFANEYAVAPHPRNFRFVKPDGQGGLLTATRDGALIRIHRFGAITVIKPLHGKPVGRDTPSGPIIDAEMFGGKIYALMEPTYKLVKPSSMKVLKTTDNFSTFTDYSADVMDSKHSTVADISSLDTLTNGDALLVGCDDQVLAVHFLMATANSAANTISPAISTGQGTWTVLSVSSGGGTGGYDETYDGTSTFGKSGAVVLQGQATTISTWVTATYNGFTKYWLRFTVTAACDASTTIAEVSVVHKRAAPSWTQTYMALGGALEASGQSNKILVGSIADDEVIWDDIYTLPYTIQGARLGLSTIPTLGSADRSLVWADQNELGLFSLPYVDEPSIGSWPLLAGDGTNTVYPLDIIPPVLFPSAVAFDGAMELRYIECHGRNFTPAVDGWQIAWKWDDLNAWNVEAVASQEHALYAMDNNIGSVLHTAFRIIDGATTDPIGPSGMQLIAWVRPAARPSWDVVPPERTAPEA